MDLDSLIYIAIAIVLAIINAIAQKKKKANREMAAASATPELDEQPDEAFEDDSDEIVDPLRVLIDKDFFSHEFTPDLERESSEPEVLEITEPKVPEELSPEQQKLLAKAQELMEETSWNESHFSYDDDSIASGSITDAATEEEQDEAFELSKSDFQKDFNAKHAIIYSEIIKPKYFPPHTNY